jgi:hypothetical protein
MTVKETSPTTRSLRSTRHSNGLHFRSRVRVPVHTLQRSQLTMHRPRAILWSSDLVRTLSSRKAPICHRPLHERDRARDQRSRDRFGEKRLWLVAVLAFVTWNLVGEGLLAELGRSQGLEEKYPRYAEWTKRLEERDEVCSIKERMAQGRAEHGLK